MPEKIKNKMVNHTKVILSFMACAEKTTARKSAMRERSNAQTG